MVKNQTAKTQTSDMHISSLFFADIGFLLVWLKFNILSS